MALIETNEIVLQAQLTQRGRFLMFGHNERFLITKFSLGDAEVNYNLVNANDTDQQNIESLTVFEPTSNPELALSSRLILKSENLEEIVKQNQYKFVPNTERKIQTHIQGSTVFSIENWKMDDVTISFAILEPSTVAYFLSDAFAVDLSAFYNKFTIDDSGEGIAFEFIPIFPLTTIGLSNKYWFIANDTFKDRNGNVVPVEIGIDNSHRTTVDDTPLAQLRNDLNIPILTFKLKLRESQVRSIYMYMLNNNVSSLTEDVVIYNNDQNVLPVTNFYGANKSYNSILTRIPLTITF